MAAGQLTVALGRSGEKWMITLEADGLPTAELLFDTESEADAAMKRSFEAAKRMELLGILESIEVVKSIEVEG